MKAKANGFFSASNRKHIGMRFEVPFDNKKKRILKYDTLLQITNSRNVDDLKEKKNDVSLYVDFSQMIANNCPILFASAVGLL